MMTVTGGFFILSFPGLRGINAIVSHFYGTTLSNGISILFLVASVVRSLLVRFEIKIKPRRHNGTKGHDGIFVFSHTLNVPVVKKQMRWLSAKHCGKSDLTNYINVVIFMLTGLNKFVEVWKI